MWFVSGLLRLSRPRGGHQRHCFIPRLSATTLFHYDAVAIVVDTGAEFLRAGINACVCIIAIELCHLTVRPGKKTVFVVVSAPLTRRRIQKQLLRIGQRRRSYGQLS